MRLKNGQFVARNVHTGKRTYKRSLIGSCHELICGNSNEIDFNLPFQYLERRFGSKLVKYLGTFACVCIMVCAILALVFFSKSIKNVHRMCNESNFWNEEVFILQLMYCATVYYGPATAIEGGMVYPKLIILVFFKISSPYFNSFLPNLLLSYYYNIGSILVIFVFVFIFRIILM